jgi:hypothetical protein
VPRLSTPATAHPKACDTHATPSQPRARNRSTRTRIAWRSLSFLRCHIATSLSIVYRLFPSYLLAPSVSLSPSLVVRCSPTQPRVAMDTDTDTTRLANAPIPRLRVPVPRASPTMPVDHFDHQKYRVTKHTSGEPRRTCERSAPCSAASTPSHAASPITHILAFCYCSCNGPRARTVVSTVYVQYLSAWGVHVCRRITTFRRRHRTSRAILVSSRADDMPWRMEDQAIHVGDEIKGGSGSLSDH